LKEFLASVVWKKRHRVGTFKPKGKSVVKANVISCLNGFKSPQPLFWGEMEKESDLFWSRLLELSFWQFVMRWHFVLCRSHQSFQSFFVQTGL